MRFEQRPIVGRITLLSASVKAYKPRHHGEPDESPALRPYRYEHRKESSKLQAPISRAHQRPGSKLYTRNNWCLELEVSLELGAWNLELSLMRLVLLFEEFTVA